MKIHETFKYGIFDCDGTLINSMMVYTKIFKGLFIKKPFNISAETSVEFYKKTCGYPLRTQVAQFLKKYAPVFEAQAEKLAKKFWEEARKTKLNYKLFPNTAEIISILRENGLLLFISSGSTIANKKIIKNNLIEYFIVVLGSEKILKGRKHIKKFAESQNVSEKNFCQKAFFIGDGIRDMKIAKECGIYAIGITNTVDAKTLKRAGADIIIAKLEELLELEF